MEHKFSYEPFVGERHETIMSEMLESHGIVPTKPAFRPPTGYVVFLGKEPVCAGFLIKCDNGMGILTDMVSNKNVKQPFRSEGVEFLRNLLSVDAEESGLQFVTSFTRHQAHVKRLETLGFQKIEQDLTQMGRFLWL